MIVRYDNYTISCEINPTEATADECISNCKIKPEAIYVNHTGSKLEENAFLNEKDLYGEGKIKICCGKNIIAYICMGTYTEQGIYKGTSEMMLSAHVTNRPGLHRNSLIIKNCYNARIYLTKTLMQEVDDSIITRLEKERYNFIRKLQQQF